MNAYYNEHTIVYDSSKAYAVHQWRNGSTASNSRLPYLSVVQNGESPNLMQIKNVYSERLSVNYIKIAVCSSSSATVITVYDSSNNPYNAFKYTSDGTDYYYVLDGTQTDWTDDLSAIGYKLQQIYTAYFESDKSDKTLNYTQNYLPMYGDNGSRMPCEQGSTLTITGFFKSDGTHATRSDGGEIGSGLIIAPINYSGSYVVGYYYGYTSLTSTIAYITYTVS